MTWFFFPRWNSSRNLWICWANKICLIWKTKTTFNFFFIHFTSRYFSSVLAELNFSEAPGRESLLHEDWAGRWGWSGKAAWAHLLLPSLMASRAQPFLHPSSHLQLMSAELKFFQPLDHGICSQRAGAPGAAPHHGTCLQHRRWSHFQQSLSLLSPRKGGTEMQLSSSPACTTF